MNTLDIRLVSHSYGKREILKDVSFTVEAGRVTMLLGPNGAGKTTLLSLITGLLAVQKGTIEGSRKTMGVVFQQPALDLELSVSQNLTYYASLHGMSRNDARARIDELLAPLDLAQRRNDRLRSLNGGHRRRVEIARALMASPSLLLLDEPTTGLDIPTRTAIVDYIHGAAVARDIAVLWTTHLADEVKPEDHVVMLHQGQVVMNGSASAISIADEFAKFTRAAA